VTAPIEDVSSLPGKKVSDHEQTPIGEVKEIYANDDGFPMWVAVEAKSGMVEGRTVLIPLARLKEEDGELQVPYSKQRITDSPEVDTDDGVSAECDHQLRGYYGIGTGDQEMWSDNKGYATLVPEHGGTAERAENVEELDTPDSDKRTEETRERLQDPGSSEIRQVTADDVTGEAEGDHDKGGGDPKDG
jgi:PRC-barrel domain